MIVVHDVRRVSDDVVLRRTFLHPSQSFLFERWPPNGYFEEPHYSVMSCPVKQRPERVSAADYWRALYIDDVCPSDDQLAALDADAAGEQNAITLGGLE